MSTSRFPRAGAGPRLLSEEEHALWQAVVRTVKPLHAAARNHAVAALIPPVSKTSANARVPHPSKAAGTPKPALPALAPFGRREKQRLARGRTKIDARIDLHGYRQAEAHAALIRFLRDAQAGGAKFVLVITGKGGRTHGTGERGVLRRQVPLWLSLPEFRRYVVSFEEADLTHGGEGALYVRVRTARAAKE